MFIQLAYAIAMMIISYAMQVLLAPKVQQPTAGDLDVPEPKAGGTVPVLFGTNIVKSANIIWYGDAKIEDIYSKGGKK